MNNSIQIKADHPLSATGRFGRLSFAAWNFLIGILTIPLVFSILFITGILSNNPSWVMAIILFVIVYAALIYCSFVFTIRRLHDLNQSGWLSLLMMAPFVNLIFMIYIFCARGTEGINNFGEHRITPDWEKILGWIYIAVIPVVFIIGVLAAIAIPAYQNSQQIQIEQSRQYSE